jgi:pilus assembly protein FimV
MGYEIAPDNALFSVVKDSSISTAEMEVAKPEMVDFYLGVSEDDTDLSETDFNLGEGNNDPSDNLSVQTATDALEPPDLDDTPQGENDLSDELEALDDEEIEDDDDISFNETDEQNLDTDSNELEDISLDFDVDDSKGLSLESDLDLDVTEDSLDSIAVSDEGISLSPSDNDENIQFDIDESSLDEDLDLLDLGSDSASDDNGFDLTTDDSIDLEEESLSIDMDISLENEDSTRDSFVPDELSNIEELALSDEVGMNDIGDLMLPDDVDEIATKLDLARVFIDMGDVEGARGSLEEVLIEGNEEQKTEANELLENI